MHERRGDRWAGDQPSGRIYDIGHSRIFRPKQTIHEESKTLGHINLTKEWQRLVETRIAQAGAVFLAAGFALQIVGIVFFES